MGRFIPQTIPRLLGVNEDENPASLQTGELVKGNNSWRRGKMRGTRPGAQRDPDVYTSQQAGSGHGLYDFVYAHDANRRLIVVTNGTVQDGITPAAIDGAITVTAGTSNWWTFATHKDLVYAAGGTGGDSFWRWDGTAGASEATDDLDGSAPTFSVISDGAAEVSPRFVFEKWNRLWTCDFRLSGGTTRSTQVAAASTTFRYSALNDGNTWPLNNTVGGTSAIGGLSAYGGEFSTGFGEFTDNNGDWLLLLTNHRLYALSETGNGINPFILSRRGAIANGCVSQRAFVSLGLDSGDAIYLSKDGIHSLRQSQEFGAAADRFLSWKIRRTFDTINQSAIENSHGTYWSQQGIVVLWVPTGTNTVPNLGICIDVKDKDSLTADNAEFDFWTLAGAAANDRAVVASTIAEDNNGDSYMYAQNASGDVFRFTPNVSSDLGVAYTVDMQTKHDDFGSAGVNKGIGDLFITTQPGGTYTPNYQTIFDYGAGTGAPRNLRLPDAAALVGTALVGDSMVGAADPTTITKVYGTGSGVTISHRFSHASGGQPFYIGAMTFQVQPFGEELGET